MYAHLSLFERKKITLKRFIFFYFQNRPLQFIKTALQLFCKMTMAMNDNDNDNDNKIDLFRHHDGNNTNIKVIFKQVTMLDKCNCI